MTRQTDKLVAALTTLDADVIGLVEVEAWAEANALDASHGVAVSRLTVAFAELGFRG